MAYLSVSRQASIRLPSCPCFHKPPCDPGRRVFPDPVLTLAFHLFAFPNAAMFKCWHTCTPHTLSLRTDSFLVPTSRCGLSRLSVRDRPWNRQVPRAPLPLAGVTAVRETSSVSSKSITPSSSLIQTHAPDLCAPFILGLPSDSRSLQVAASPCCTMALPVAISVIFPCVSGSILRPPPRCFLPFLPSGHWPSPRKDWVGVRPFPQRLLLLGR